MTRPRLPCSLTRLAFNTSSYKIRGRAGIDGAVTRSKISMAYKPV